MTRLTDLLWEVQEATEYKPHSMVMVHESREIPGVIEVYVSIPTRDAWDHEKPYRVGGTHTFPAYPVVSLLADGKYGEAVRLVLGEIRRAILHLEQHEADEFITFKGGHPFDPHKAVKDAFTQSR